jgi:uncharacterized protein involved in exopolysaccharide biosynthesis
MTDHPQEPLSPPRAALQVLGRQWPKMLLFSALTMIVVAAVILFSPRAYRSTAELFVRLGRENVTLDPTATLGQNPVVAVPSTRENEINTVVEVLKSRALLERVVSRLGSAALLEGVRGGDEPEDARERALRQSKALRQLSRGLTVEAVKKTNVVRIDFEAASPEAAQEVVTALVELYLEHHARLNRTPGAHQFLQEQASQARAQLLRAEGQLRDAQAETGLFAPEAQKQLAVARLGRLQDELLQAGAGLAAARAEVELLRARVGRLPETVETARTKGFPNEAANSMRAQLYALQLKEQELLSRHPAEHPEVVLIRQQVGAAREILAREEQSREQVTTGPGRLYEEARLTLLRQEPLVASLASKVATLKGQLEAERGVLKAINEGGLRLAELQRGVELQTTLYRRYAENLAQTQVDQALEAQKISNINISQPATFDAEPVRPRRLLYLAAGLVVALAGSVAVAGLAEGQQGRAPAAEGGAPPPDNNGAPPPAPGALPSRAEAPPLHANR